MKAVVPYLIVIIALSVGLYLKQEHDSQKIHDYQVQACQRGNLLREESNRRIHSHQVDKDVLDEFLQAAIKARKATGTPVDLKAADRYAALALKLETQVHFGPIALVDCRSAVPNP